ncbi:DUF3054 domain-containing protein [Mycobacterium sp. NPDC051804]|uniref:DUF3054 domain-containing protein n=1 Tax=Mycobacterium sp. NPDC051804 TaxID=3364295 RepID=UPI0037B8C7DC
MPIVDDELTRPALTAFATDVVCVVVFCTIGRRSHAEGLTVSGIAETAWPFLVGTLTGWLSPALRRGPQSRAWHRPAALVPTGVAVWLCTVVVGMLLRKLTSAGTAPSFIVVASLSTALLLLGWRAAAALLIRR